MDVDEWFPVNFALRQDSVKCPWFINVYMDGVVREVNARMLGNSRNCCVRMVAGLR